MNAERFQPANGESPGLSCFLVEDSALIRQNLCATLEELLQVRMVGEAASESDALRWLGSGEAACDLMIIDIFLRGGTGLSVLRHARTRLPDAKLVVLTNYATPEMRRRCLSLGADRVFDKSAEVEDLLAYCERLSDADRPA